MLSAIHRGAWSPRVLLPLLALAACEPTHRDGDLGDDGLGQVVAADAAVSGALAPDAAAPAARFQLTVVKAGSRRGTVRASVGQLACTGTACSAVYPAGTRVTLTAEPFAGGAFSGWLGACTGIAPCTVALTADTTVTADFTGGPNIAFVTSEQVPASFGGLVAADARCNAAAQGAGLPGRYVALLYDARGVDPLTRLAGARGWVRPDGKVVADTVEALRAQGPLYPLRLDERGFDHASDVMSEESAVLAWTGTDLTGDPRFFGGSDVGTKAYSCDGWTITAAEKFGGVGAGAASGAEFGKFSIAQCGWRARLFCFGVGNQAEVVPPPAAGRLGFVTRAPWVPSGGLAGADATCQAEARAAGRAGTFRALLATPTSSAASRFDTTGAAWVRPDGTPLTARGDSLQTEAIPLVTPPTLDARGERVGSAGYWLGATSLRTPGSSETTCAAWTASAAPARGRAGKYSTVITPFLAFGNLDLPCGGADRTHGLLCLQE